LRPILLAGVLVWLAATAQGAVTVSVTADPPLPVPNLLHNPGFELGSDMPESWAVSSGMPELFRFQRQSRGRSGACLRVQGLSSIMSGYLAQHFAVTPGTRYVGGAWLRLRAGHCLIWLLAYPSGQRWDVYIHKASWGGNPLVPDFVPLDYTNGGYSWVGTSPDAADSGHAQWSWVGQEFTTEPAQNSLNFHVGSYFERGDMDFDDCFLGLARTKLSLQVSGAVLKEVRVESDAGKLCWSSGALPDGTTAVRQELPDLSTQLRYKVVALTAAGEEVQRWYPQ
jgi:hypothetical protein